MDWLITIIRVFFALILGGSGIYHFVNPDFFMPLMPDFLPAHKMLIYLSGVAEIIVAIALFIAPVQNLAAWGVIILLIIFTPIHILDMLKDKPAVGSKRMAVNRLIMQFAMLGMAYSLLP
ncbi:MAG: MauE/DoxX family redox-associated membrane protein [Chloroflexota bacterium]